MAQVLYGVPIHLRFDRAPVDALGLDEGRVVAAGSLSSVRTAMPAGASERRLDRGAVLPAFIDPHLHAYLVASDPSTDVLLRKALTVRELVDLVGRLAAAAPAPGSALASVDPGAGSWLRYHGYEPLLLAEHRSPTAAELDRAVPDRPLHVQSRTYHESVVNSAGLDALGIGRTTADPPGGRILRDGRGRPTGVLLESASFLAEAVSGRADALDPQAWRGRLEAFARRLLSHGITRIADAAVPAVVAADFCSILDAAGVAAQALLVGSRIDEPHIAAGSTAKVLLDGGEFCHLCMTGSQLGSLLRGSFRAGFGPEGATSRAVGMRAGMPRRETDRRWHTGLRFPTEEAFPALLRQAAEAGGGLAVHAVGNGAVESVLTGLAADLVVARSVPLRVEHAMVLEAWQAAALGGAGIPVVAQPGFLVTTGHELTISPMPPGFRLVPLRQLREAGVPLAFSSDHPATPLDPFVAVSAAVTRLDARGLAIDPSQALTLAEALTAQTQGAAHALGIGSTGAGTLEPGSPADLAWWPVDPVAADPLALPGLTALETWRAGESVYVSPLA